MSERIENVFNSKRKILCFLFATVVLSVSPAFVFVAAETPDFKIAVASSVADPGGFADVSVSFAHNPGVAAFSLRMDYDAAMLTPVSIEQGAVLDVGSLTSNLHAGDDSSKLAFVSAVWVNPENFTGDGVVYTVKFKIGEFASGGIPVSISYDAGGIVNQNYEDIEAEIENGSISIRPASGSDAPALSDATPAPASADTGSQGASSGGTPQSVVDTDRETPSELGGGASSQDEASPITGVWNNPFRDVADADWFYDSVRYVCEKGLMKGVANSVFAPQTPVSRAMFATILYRLAGEPPANAKHSFSDVSVGQWYTDAIAWASENAIVMGYGDRFGIDDPITREQIATVLYRYAADKGIDASAESDLRVYSDAGDISEWAADALKWAGAKGILTGRSETELAPKDTASRAEAAAVLRRLMEQ
jgi:hypothetical protein